MDTATLEPSTRPAGTTDWAAVAREVGAGIAPDAAAHDERGEMNREAFALLRDSGITAMLVPPELGGGGASHGEACEVLRTLGRCCSSTAVALSMHQHLVATQVWRHHRGQPAAATLARVAAERLVLVSTGAADWVDSSGTAVPVDGGYRVSARKSPSSGAPVGDVLVASFPTEHPDGAAVIHCSVPLSAPGVTIEPTWDAMGLRATGSDTVVLEDVFVPEAAVSLVRPAGVWHPVWNTVLGVALPLIMSAYLGIAEAAVEQARATAGAKAEQPHVAPLVGEMLNHVTTAHDAVASMTRAVDGLRFDATDDVAAAALTRKTIAAEASIAAVRAAIDVVGGAGYARPFGLERLYRDVHGGTFHPLPRAKQVRFTGRHALGLDPLG